MGLPRRSLLAGASGLLSAQTAGQRPNMVVILMDDARADELHCTGHAFVKTPNIDRLAAQGATFRNAFATTPLCSPSRASFLTGRYAHSHGITDNTDRSPQSHELITFPMLLQKGGYQTAFIGKWHMGLDDTPRPGWDHWVGFKGQGTYIDSDLNVDGKHVNAKGYTTDVLSDYAVEFLKRKHEKPFLLYLPHKALHPELTQYADGSLNDPKGGTFLPPDRYKNTYDSVTVKRAPSAAQGPVGKPALLRDIPGMPPLSPKTGTDDETIRNRARMMMAVDDGVGRMLQALEGSGQLDNTVFVFTSDEGYFFGEHGLSVERRLAYEESIRIPMLIRYPKLAQAGSTIDGMALNIDLAPTLLEMGGVDASIPMHGRSLVPLLKGNAKDWRDSILIEYYSDKVFPRMRNMGYKSVRTDRWKLIHYTDLNGMDELYDLKVDPYEMKNIAGTNPKVMAEMMRRLDQLLQASK